MEDNKDKKQNITPEMEDIKGKEIKQGEEDIIIEKVNADGTTQPLETGAPNPLEQEPKDILTMALVGDVRIYVARTTNLVREAAKRHGTSHLATAALGRAMTGAALLAATMKNKECVSLNFKGDGPIGGVVADAEGCNCCGYVGNPDVFLPPKNGHLDVGGAVGRGTLQVIRYSQNGKPFTGAAPLVDGEIANDLTHYLYSSEQTPSSVALGVRVNVDGEVVAAGGWFIQALPGCSDEVLEALDKNVRQTPYVSDLLDMGYMPSGIIKLLSKGLKYKLLDTIPLQFRCHCSREKVEGMMATLKPEDLEDLAKDPVTEIQCHFCNEKYKFTSDEMKAMAAQVREAKNAKK